MVLRNRRDSVLIVLVCMGLGFTGCMGVDSYEPPVQRSGYTEQSPYNRMAGGPYGGAQQAGGIQQVGYTQPSQAMNKPGSPMAPGQQVVVEGMEPGMPLPDGMPNSFAPPPLPTEKAMVTHPPHRVAAPDTLFLQALRVVPRGPYRLEALETLIIEVPDALPKKEIKGFYMISPEGNINLGFEYGTVRVGGLTIEQAQAAIRNHLSNILKSPTVNIALQQIRTLQNVFGEHLVRPDGTISLGVYGSVPVAGLTVGQIKCVIEKYLSAYLVDPQIAVDVMVYNSRRIYVIAEGAGYGQQVIVLPSTGNETVLDIISRVNGLPPVSCQSRIWVARPSPAGHPCSIILPVDWKAIVQAGHTETNYQLFPGDRVYIGSNPLVALYNYMDMFLAPIERVLGVTLLGSTTVNSLRGNVSTGLVVR